MTHRLGVVALLVASLAGPVRAQERAGYQAYPSESPEVVSVAPREHYAAGRLHQAAFGRRSRDGREFSFRSIDKDPTDAVPEPFRNTVVHRLVQDGTSAMNPAGAVVAPVLLDGDGSPLTRPRSSAAPAPCGDTTIGASPDMRCCTAASSCGCRSPGCCRARFPPGSASSA